MPSDKTVNIQRESSIKALRASVHKLLEPRLNSVVTAMTDHMFSLSSGSNMPPDKRRQAFEAFSALKVQGRVIVAAMQQSIDSGYAQLVSPPRPVSGDILPDRLDLIDLEEFEDTLAIDRMVKVGSERYWVPLEAITLRIAKMMGVEPEFIRLPFDVRGLCTAYRQSLKNLNFNQAILSELDKSFAQHLLTELGHVYDTLNDQLEQEGLLPGLEETIETEGSQLESSTNVRKPEPSKPGVDPGSTSQNLQRPTRSEAPGAERIAGVEAPYLSDLGAAPVGTQDHTGHAHAPIAPRGPLIGRPLIGTNSLPAQPPSVLETAAAAEGSANFLPGRGTQRLATSLAPEVLSRVRNHWGDSGVAALEGEALTAEAAVLIDSIAKLRASGFIPTSGHEPLLVQLGFDQLGPELEPAKGSINLVDNLYQTMMETLPITDALALSLQALKLPLAQLSLSEPDFYQNREHPARLLIERLTEVAALAPRNNRRIEQQINEILSGLNSEYDGEIEVFDRALAKITDLALGMLKQQRRSIQRQVAAEEGKEKRHQAANKVEQDLMQSLGDTELPEVLLRLIDLLLRDTLTVMALKGDSEAPYRAVIDRIGMLNRHLSAVAAGHEPLSNTAADSELAGLTTALDHQAFMSPEQESALAALHHQLTGRESVALISSTLGKLDVFTEPGFSERLKSLPRLQRWVKRARELPLNTWLTEQLPEGRLRSIQLIWRNDDGTRFAFSNEQGQKIRDLNIVRLARWLGSNLRPLTPSEQLPIIERSVFSTLERRQADLSTITRPTSSEDLSRGQLIDWLQSAIRRARRRGSTHTLIALHSNGSDDIHQWIRDRVARLGFTIEVQGNISPTTHGFLINSTGVEALGQHLKPEHSTELTGIGMAVVDASHGGAESLLQIVEDTAKRGLALAPNTVIVAEQERRPTDLAAAVRHTYSRLLEDMPPRLSLRRIHRSSCADPETKEYLYQVLLDSNADTARELARQSGYHSSALTIALDCLKVKAVCEYSERISTAGHEVPAFSLRLSTDAALHHEFLDFVLTQVSDSGIGTDRLCIELRDSSWLREESRIADFSRTLRSIGCHVAISGVNPSRGTTSQLQILRPHMLALDTSLWPPDATRERLPHLHQAISDLHHLVGEHVVFRDERERELAAELGIDFIERVDDREMTPEALLEELPRIQR